MQGCLHTVPPATPQIEQLPRAVRAAPRTFLLRNSLTREAATSSTKRLSMLRSAHEAAAPQPQIPGPLGPVWPRCRGDGVIRAGELRPFPGSARAGKAEGKGRSNLQTCSESWRRNAEGTSPVHPRDQAAGSGLGSWHWPCPSGWPRTSRCSNLSRISQGVNWGECLAPGS